MHLIDYSLIILYCVAILWLGFARKLKDTTSTAELIVGGRMLTLPAFVASLVSTWYGGILGVGEYSYRYGLSNWLVFGLPYYVAAFLFAMLLAKKARQSEAVTIPERLASAYDNKTAVLGGIIIYLMTVPGAYVLSMGILCEQIFGWSFWMSVVFFSLFSILYLFLGGFGSVVRTDIFQTVFMFLGFAVLLVFLVIKYGGLAYIAPRVPESHLTWHGGQSGWYIATWYVIALATLVEPAFFQRCYAAKTARTARWGIIVSIACWAIFDFMTTSCGLYARALLPDLADPVSSFPMLALKILPVGVMGLFALAMFSTVQSTVDSYFFISASTFGNDIMARLSAGAKKNVLYWTRVGLLVSAAVAVSFVLVFRSVVDIWYAFGSIGTPALLVPVLFSFTGRRRFSGNGAFATILVAGGISLVWYLSKNWTGTDDFWLGLQPIFPGLAISLISYGALARRRA